MIPILFAQADPIGIPGPDLVPPLWQTLTALVVVLGLLGGLAWLVRRSQFARRTSGGMAVESALALGERRSLVVVTVEGRRLLLGLAPNHVALVTELGEPRTFEDAVRAATETAVMS